MSQITTMICRKLICAAMGCRAPKKIMATAPAIIETAAIANQGRYDRFHHAALRQPISLRDLPSRFQPINATKTSTVVAR